MADITIPKAAIDAGGDAVYWRMWADISYLPVARQDHREHHRVYCADVAEAAIRAALPYLGEPAAWVRKWNYHGHPNDDEFTDSADLAEQWRTHPQTDTVHPLYLAPPLPPAPVVPEGWKLVPIEPTREMRTEMLDRNRSMPAHYADLIWSAALAAAPQPPVAAPVETFTRAEMLAEVERRLERAMSAREALTIAAPTAAVAEQMAEAMVPFAQWDFYLTTGEEDIVESGDPETLVNEFALHARPPSISDLRRLRAALVAHRATQEADDAASSA